MMLSAGSFKTFLLAILRSKDNSSTGKSNKLAIIASNKVPEISAPRATVPPKFEVINTENPKTEQLMCKTYLFLFLVVRQI